MLIDGSVDGKVINEIISGPLIITAKDFFEASNIALDSLLGKREKSIYNVYVRIVELSKTKISLDFGSWSEFILIELV